MTRLIRSAAIAALAATFSMTAWAAPVSRADKEFMVKAAQNGAVEVDASTAAKTNAASPDVKAFADMMITDHTKVAEELKALADSKGVAVPLQPSEAQQSQIHQMSMKMGPAFDAAYVKDVGVKAHMETIALFKKASTSATDPDVKAFAAKTLPSLEMHLEHAKSLQASMPMAKK